MLIFNMHFFDNHWVGLLSIYSLFVFPLLWVSHEFCHIWASQVVQVVKNLPGNTGDWGSIHGLERSLEKEMATHSSVLAWRIPWTEEPGGLQLRGSQKSWIRLSDWALYSHLHLFLITDFHIFQCFFNVHLSFNLKMSAGVLRSFPS